MTKSISNWSHYLKNSLNDPIHHFLVTTQIQGIIQTWNFIFFANYKVFLLLFSPIEGKVFYQRAFEKVSMVEINDKHILLFQSFNDIEYQVCTLY